MCLTFITQEVFNLRTYYGPSVLCTIIYNIIHDNDITMINTIQKLLNMFVSQGLTIFSLVTPLVSCDYFSTNNIQSGNPGRILDIQAQYLCQSEVLDPRNWRCPLILWIRSDYLAVCRSCMTPLSHPYRFNVFPKNIHTTPFSKT